MLIISKPKLNFLNKTAAGKIYDQDTLLVSYKLQYPQFLSISSTDQLSEINICYCKKAIQFQSYSETYLYSRSISHYSYSLTHDSAFNTYQGILTYTPAYNKNCNISLYFDEYFYEGGAHGRTTRAANTWNLETGNEYPISAFFRKDMDYEAYLTYHMTAQINTQVANGSTAYFDDYETLIVERFDPHNFYLTNTGMTVFYQEYDLGPYASGIREFIIPYAKNILMEPQCGS